MTRIVFLKRASGYLDRIPPKQARRILGKIRLLAEDNSALRANIKPLKGRDGSRLRIGDIRVIYKHDGNRIIILDIGPRGGIYR